MEKLKQEKGATAVEEAILIAGISALLLVSGTLVFFREQAIVNPINKLIWAWNMAQSGTPWGP